MMGAGICRKEINFIFRARNSFLSEIINYIRIAFDL